MITSFGKSVASLSEERRLRFYEILARRLTIAIRIICSNENLDPEQKVEQVRYINEIMHRVIAKIVGERLQIGEWLDTDFEAMVQDFVNMNPRVEWFINDAISSSFDDSLNDL